MFVSRPILNGEQKEQLNSRRELLKCGHFCMLLFNRYCNLNARKMCTTVSTTGIFNEEETECKNEDHTKKKVSKNV